MKKLRIKTQSLIISVLLVLASVTVAHATDSNWHADTKSYRVYLGVVPVFMIKDNPKLIDQEKSLHGGLNKAKDDSQHVMVSIFSKKDNKRILNATVIARIKQKKLVGGGNTIKPLEKMLTSGAVTYGNYFELTHKEDYVIEVDIYQSNMSGFEKASFNFKAY